MKKAIRVIVLTGMALVMGEVTEAGVTTTYVDVIDYSNAFAENYFLPPGTSEIEADYYRWYSEDWGWMHVINSQGVCLSSINEATLEINAFDVDAAEIDLIYADGIMLDQLEVGDSIWNVTTFDFSSHVLKELADGKIEIWMDIDSSSSINAWAVTLQSSTLTVNCEVIPSPSAVVLYSIGMSLVGWMRRRKTL